MVRTVTPQRGFTLLEVVVYLALFGVLMTGVIRTVYELLETSRETAVALAIQNDGSFVLQKIAWALGDVETIAIIDTTTLEIVRSDDVANPLRFSVEDGRFYLKRGSEEKSPLTNLKHNVYNVSFVLTHPTPESNYLKVSFLIDDAPFSLAWPQYE